MLIRRHRITIEIEQRTFRMEQRDDPAEDPSPPDAASSASATTDVAAVPDGTSAAKPALRLPKKT